MTPMPHRIIIRKEAEADIADAAIWYERQKTDLGDEFLAEIESAIASAAENPFRYPCFRRRPEVRRVLVTRFPYRVFFIRRQNDVVVFRVLHGAMHDREWKANIPDD